jgi:hypothetical protein
MKDRTKQGYREDLKKTLTLTGDKAKLILNRYCGHANFLNFNS